jgi:hypothetical protein
MNWSENLKNGNHKYSTFFIHWECALHRILVFFSHWNSRTKLTPNVSGIELRIPNNTDERDTPYGG